MTRISMRSRHSLANLRVCGTGTDVCERQRVYRNGSALCDHLKLETRVISGIVHIDSDLGGPFPIQIEDGTGKLASLNPKPGQLILYESAKCLHQRSAPMSQTPALSPLKLRSRFLSSRPWRGLHPPAALRP